MGHPTRQATLADRAGIIPIRKRTQLSYILGTLALNNLGGLDPSSFFKRISFIRLLPGKFNIVTAKVAVGSRLAEDGSA